MSSHHHLKSIAFIVSHRMKHFSEFEDVFWSNHAIDFGYKGVQYYLSFRYDPKDNYSALLDNYHTDIVMNAMTIGRMLRGDLRELRSSASSLAASVPGVGG